MSLNRAILIGRLTRAPEFKYTPSGTAVASFSLAVDRNVAPNAQGEKACDFIPCTAWQKQAEFAANYLKKGRLVAVEGRIQVRRYQASDGQNRTFTEVVCDRLQGLDRPKDEDASGPSAAAAAAVGGGNVDDDDPFAGGR